MTGGPAHPNRLTDTEITMFRSALVALATIALGPAAARADQYNNQVRVQMFATALGNVADGFTLAVPLQTGGLRQGEYTTYTLTMNGSQRYRLVANCDNDCGDIDIAVTEADGREIARCPGDRRDGDLAVVDISGHPGNHTVKVSMAGCAADPAASASASSPGKAMRRPGRRPGVTDPGLFAYGSGAGRASPRTRSRK